VLGCQALHFLELKQECPLFEFDASLCSGHYLECAFLAFLGFHEGKDPEPENLAVQPTIGV